MQAVARKEPMPLFQKRDKEQEAITKEISRAVKKLHGCDDDESEPDDDSTDDESDTLSDLPSCLLAIKNAKDDMLKLIGADPCEFVKGELTKYVESIPDDCKTRGDISIIENSVAEIEKLLKHVIPAQDQILYSCGISPEWHAADTVSRFLRTTVAYLEDIQILAMSGGVPELTTAHMLGELIVDLRMRVLLTKYECVRSALATVRARAWDVFGPNGRTVTVQFSLSNMAPRKWTSPEQEEWLSPWYEKYRTKQSDKAKNWANFFTDLLGEWLEVFPEPRPVALPLIGPLTRDEIIIMDQAEADRKKKLENRFKNCLGTTKTGRQAKAEAANVFHAVLKSVTEGEKPTRSLQEVEAYSKLYYQRRVKSIVDNKLKAEAEVLQAENKALTNGMRVAIVKRETANLYEVETNEVKAEVRKYIEEAKMRRDNEKDGVWSEDDYAKNLEKLAAMVNKFLKGLADATGFSFSLLAGGPSPELGGLIDVYSFHVGETKFGNDFSKAYPDFEDAIMSPFRDYLYRVYPHAAASLKQRPGGVEDLNDGDDDDPSWSGVELGNQHDTFGGHVTSSSLTTASVTPPDSVKATSNVDQIPGNSTDTWQNLDDTFWQGLTAQIDAFEASGGNPDLPHLPPYPRTGSSTVAVLNSPSSPTTPLPSSSELPADTFPEASTQLPNESRSSPTSVPQSSPTSPSTTLSPMPILSRPHGVSQPGLLSTPRDLPTQSPATAASLIPPSITTAGQ
ncbi:hypothetical protein EV424DRAFT_1345110 [Suillus variegatus]|nr:hypothetical protein EV424DRAFT_1345110 [Suillus variegatus]